MPSSVVKNKADEKLWSKARAQASKQGKDENWAYVMHIFQNMKKNAGASKLVKFAASINSDAMARDFERYDSMYDSFDRAHDRNHVNAVRQSATRLGKAHAPDYSTLIAYAATLHDIGLIHGREGHEAAGEKMVRNDPELAKRFSPEEIAILAEAVGQHRASTGRPEHIVAKIISDADRVSSADTVSALRRAYEYREGLSDEEAMRGALAHLAEKYGKGSYGRRSYFPETEKELDAVYSPIMDMAKNEEWEKALSMINKKASASESQHDALMQILQQRGMGGGRGMGMGLGLGSGGFGEGYRSNSPTMAYETAYGKKPDRMIMGLSGTPRKEWNGIQVDADLKDEWLDALNGIDGIEVRSTEQGKDADRIAHVAFRLKNPDDDKRAATIVENLNKQPGVQAKTDNGAQGRPRIMVVGKTWKGNEDWEGWWNSLPDKIQTAMSRKTSDSEDSTKLSSFDFGWGNQFSLSPGPKGDYIRAYRMSQGRSSHTLNRAKRQLPDNFPENRLGDMHQLARERRPVDLTDVMARNSAINKSSNRRSISKMVEFAAMTKSASYDDNRAELAKELGPEDMDKVDTFAASLGLGPKYVPKPEKKFVCPKCGKKNAILREVHADTDMNCMELECPDCGYKEEDPKELKPSEETTSKLAKFAQHILITGLPGAGKTTLGRQRAEELGIPHVELDKYFPKKIDGEFDKRTALEIINSIKEPSVIEGVQIMGENPKDLVDHKIEVVDAPDDRLMRVFLESESWKGRPDQKEKIREAISNKRSILNKFVAAMGEDQDRDMDKLSSLMKFATAAGAKLDKSIKSQDINTNPSEAQKESGTYKKGKIRLYGLEISIENPKGSFRKGIGPDGKEWKNKMKHHYGYIKGTIGKDKDHLDIFIGNNPESDKVFIVNQKFGNKFDEHKIMLGFDSKDQAKKGYLANYEKGWKGFGSIHECSVNEFKDWLKNGNTKRIFKGGSMNKLLVNTVGHDKEAMGLGLILGTTGAVALASSLADIVIRKRKERISGEKINTPNFKYVPTHSVRHTRAEIIEDMKNDPLNKKASRTAAWISAAGALASMIYAGAYLKDRKERQDWEKKIEQSMAARGTPGEVFIPEATPLVMPKSQFSPRVASASLLVKFAKQHIK